MGECEIFDPELTGPHAVGTQEKETDMKNVLIEMFSSFERRDKSKLFDGIFKAWYKVIFLSKCVDFCWHVFVVEIFMNWNFYWNSLIFWRRVKKIVDKFESWKKRGLSM